MTCAIHLPLAIGSVSQGVDGNPYPLKGISMSKTLLAIALIAGLACTTHLAAQDIEFELVNDLVPGGQPADIQLADIDADGMLDVIVLFGTGSLGCCFQGPIQLYRQDSPGVYDPPIEFPVLPEVPVEVRVADFDQDGNLDMAVVGVFSVTVEIFYGDGNFGFTSEAIQSSVVLFHGLDVADLDGDAFPDLLLGELGSGSVKMLLNDGTSFTEVSVPLPTPGQWGILPFDGNGDGITDIMVGLDLFFPTVAYYLRGTGGGNFDPAVEFPTSGDIWDLAAGDIDNDGDIDVIGVGYMEVTHTVLLGDGAGGFTLGTPIDAGVGSPDLELVDLNLDGNLDLVVPREFANGIDVYAGTGTGEFVLEKTIPGDASYKIATGDLDLDGVPDLATSSVYNSWVELLRNTTDVVVPGTQFYRGDANQDSSVDISDAIFLLSILFVTPEPVLCEDAADANDEGSIDISDAIYTLSALFVSSAAPFPAPGSLECGVDPTDDGLECELGCP